MGRTLLEGFFSILSGRLLKSAITIVSLPVIVRVLEPSGYGNYAFMLSTLTLLLVVTSSVVTEGVQKFVAESRDRETWASDVFGFYFRLAAVLSALGVGLVLAFVLTGGVERVYGAGYTTEFYVLAVLIVVIQLRQLMRRVLMAFELERYSEPLQVLNKLLSIGLGLGLAVLGHGVVGMLVGLAIGNSIVAIVGLGIVFRRIPVSSIVRIPDESFPRRQLLSFNIKNLALVLLMMSLYHVDVVMLRTLVDSEQTGYYKAALAMAEYIWIIPVSIESLFVHSTATLWSEEAYDRINALAARITRYTVLLTTLLAIGIAALSARFVPLYYGSAYTPILEPLLWLLPGTIGLAVARPLIGISRGNGRLGPLIAATGAAATLNLILNAMLIPRYGMAGAAIATSIGYSSMVLLHTGCARYIGFDPLQNIRFSRLVVTGVATAAVVFTADMIIRPDIVALLVVPPLGLVTHLGVALKVGALDRGEAQAALDSLPLSVPSYN